MGIKNQDYIERSDRSVFVTSAISVDLYNKCFSRICKLRVDSEDPICLYLDSFGGSVQYAELLHRLLKTPRYDGSECRLITVVPSVAASAAAGLLILGDYAIAYPNAEIVCHGSRFFDLEITTENTNLIERKLREANRNHVEKILMKVFHRLVFRVFLFNRTPSVFDWAVDDKDSLNLNNDFRDVTSYLRSVHGALSLEGKFRGNGGVVSGQSFLDGVFSAWDDLHNVIKVTESTKGMKDSLKALVTHELAQLEDDGVPDSFIGKLQLDLNRLYEVPSIEGDASTAFHETKMFLMTEEESKVLATSTDEEEIKSIDDAVAGRFVDMWHFTSCLCHRLNEQDNAFTAVDAYLLGLIDEVCGVNECISKRYLETEVLNRSSEDVTDGDL